MKLRLLFLVLVVMFCSNAFAEDIPNPNDVGMRKVQGVVIDTENVSTSRRGNGGGGVTGNVAVFALGNSCVAQHR